MMKTIANSVLLTIVILTAMPWATGAEKKVTILAYVNQTSGCQRPTEAFLRELDSTYGDRVSLEFVDFGAPKGQKRWRDDGMKCMTILLNGSSEADIVYKGVDLTVGFNMPAGHLWLHNELGTAVRQLLQGVSAEDRQGPELKAQKDDGAYTVRANDAVILDGLSKEKAGNLVTSLTKATTERPLTQDDFSMKTTETGAVFLLRDAVLVHFDKVDTPADSVFERIVAEMFTDLIKPFPRISRPFPGLKPGPRR